MKNLNQHVGTPYTSRKARSSDGHRTNDDQPRPKARPDSGERETAEEATQRRLREGGKGPRGGYLIASHAARKCI